MKTKALIILLSSLIITSCGQTISLSREEESDSPKEEEIVPNEDVKQKSVSELTEDEYIYFPVLYLNKLDSLKSYKAVTTGSTKSTVLFINVNQEINTTVIKGEYLYQHNSSYSSVYSSEHEAFYHEGKALYKNKGEEEYSISSLKDYLDKYGTYPFNNTIEGYKISKDSIVNITKEENDEDNYQFKLVFNVENATNNVRIQMKEFGQLDDYPVFDSVEIAITVKNDFTPIRLDLESKYTAKKVTNSSCHQTYTVTYSNINEEIEIPNIEKARELFNS